MDCSVAKEYLSKDSVINRVASYLHGINVIELDGFNEASARLQGISDLLGTTGFSKDVSFLVKQYLVPGVSTNIYQKKRG
jgi:hypothetical protein